MSCPTSNKYSRVIQDDLVGLGLSYDLFTRTSTDNHHRVTQDLFSALHLGTAWLLMAVLFVHIGAAMKHLVVDRDGVFQRMWPWGRTAGSA